jgi:hypothetical protein
MEISGYTVKDIKDKLIPVLKMSEIPGTSFPIVLSDPIV